MILGAVAALALVCAPQANATMEITLTNGASSVTVQDGGANDSCAAVNCVTFSGSVGNYSINVSTGINSTGLFNPFLDLNSVNVVLPAIAGGPAGPPGTLVIMGSANGYTAATPNFSFHVSGTPPAGWGTSFAAYGGNSNTLFDMSNQIGSTLSFPTTGLPFVGMTGGLGNTANPYSLTIAASINASASGTASFDAALNAVPEPVSVSMLGGVLLLTASALRRKFARPA